MGNCCGNKKTSPSNELVCQYCNHEAINKEWLLDHYQDYHREEYIKITQPKEIRTRSASPRPISRVSVSIEQNILNNYQSSLSYFKSESLPPTPNNSEEDLTNKN